MSHYRHPIENKNGHFNHKFFIDLYRVPTKPNPKTDDTIMREMVLKEIEERCSNGETLEKVAEEIANRDEIQEHFSYFKRNNVNSPLKNIFMNWYLAKQKNNKHNNEINRWWEDK